MNAFDALLTVARAQWRAAGAPGRVLAAVSGGADSVGLLRVLAALAREEGFFLAAAHVDHGLRAASPADAAFVESLCAAQAIPCRTARLTLPRADENAAREARYQALYRFAEEFSADVIALAHHENDQAETVLMHLMRGCGGDGLTGMASLRPVPGEAFSLWRPFLAVSPDVLRAALHDIHQPWREDESNQSDAYLRNRLRHHVLPALGEGAAARIGQTARLQSDENDYLNAAARDALRRVSLAPPCVFLETAALDGMHIALKRRALLIFCREAGVDADCALIEGLLALPVGGKLNLPGGAFAERTAARLHFVFPGAPPLMRGALRETPYTGDPGDGKRRQAAPVGALSGAVLRYRQPGDVITPFGMTGKKSLQDYFVDRGIDRPFRDHTPLFCLGSEVLWAVGAGASERLRVANGTAATVYEYMGKLPTDTKEDT